jgi:hypothetical protein
VAGVLLQEEVLKEHADSARKRKEAAEAAATPEERVVLYAAKKDAAKELQKREVHTFPHESIWLQVHIVVHQAKEVLPFGKGLWHTAQHNSEKISSVRPI